MTTCYKATNSKDSLVYILRRIHGKWTRWMVGRPGLFLASRSYVLSCFFQLFDLWMPNPCFLLISGKKSATQTSSVLERSSRRNHLEITVSNCIISPSKVLTFLWWFGGEREYYFYLLQPLVLPVTSTQIENSQESRQMYLKQQHAWTLPQTQLHPWNLISDI